MGNNIRMEISWEIVDLMPLVEDWDW